MPQAQGSRNQPQRRVFRGRGGPTDGNLPPKKVTRPRVKYQPEEKQPGPPGREDEAAGEGVSEVGGVELASDGNFAEQASPCDDVEGEQENQRDGKFMLEIDHLIKRVQNVQSSLQTSQGLADPEKWRTNCLLPTKNVVREWRSIVSFHEAGEGAIEDSDTTGNGDSNNNDGGRDDVSETLHSTAQKVFGLVQMSMQTGPLVGSNPGYFKRCGGDVASVALVFLREILELAGGADAELGAVAEEAAEEDVNRVVETDCPAEKVEDMHRRMGQEVEQEADAGAESESEDSSADPSDGSDSDSESSSSSSETHESNIEVVGAGSALLEEANAAIVRAHQAQEVIIINNLQRTLLFTERQSQRFHQWLRNAENAAEKNRPASKSAAKLQAQKSKKQRQKELKMERKMKKKKKGGRG